MTGSSSPALQELLLSLVPPDGTSIGNGALRKALETQIDGPFPDGEYERIRNSPIE
jgi:hypothetical protein